MQPASEPAGDQPGRGARVMNENGRMTGRVGITSGAVS